MPVFDVQAGFSSWVVATVTLLVGSLATWLLGEAVRFLRTRISVERQRELYEAAVWCVRYVEQEWQSGRLARELRLEEAITRLQESVPWVSMEMARQAVEGAVRAVKESLGQVDTPAPPSA